MKKRMSKSNHRRGGRIAGQSAVAHSFACRVEYWLSRQEHRSPRVMEDTLEGGE